MTIKFNTNGKGLWSDVAKEVPITNMFLSINQYEDGATYGELLVYFDRFAWNTSTDGLIYTDPQFQKELRAFLNSQGLTGSAVYYSEQGMQGDNYVSLDADDKFCNEWIQKFEGCSNYEIEEF